VNEKAGSGIADRRRNSTREICGGEIWQSTGCSWQALYIYHRQLTAGFKRSIRALPNLDRTIVRQQSGYIGRTDPTSRKYLTPHSRTVVVAPYSYGACHLARRLQQDKKAQCTTVSVYKHPEDLLLAAMSQRI
jgi:hypothetical protein